MRDIRFRAWDKKCNRMFDNDYLVQAYGGMVKTLKIVMSNMGEAPLKGLFLPLGDSDMEFLQFVGRSDKNGKDVYEGDVLQNEFGRRWVVCWTITEDFSGWILRVINPDSLHEVGQSYKDFEVIGNKWSNPDLLNKASQAERVC